jgi:hypothetical protein
LEEVGGQIIEHRSADPLVLRLDTEFSESVLVRLEASPGFYGVDYDDFGRDTFNVPVILGGTYIYSSNLQFVFGIGIDALRDNPENDELQKVITKYLR